MSLRICVLGSGSGGNATLVELDGRAMLIDAGFGPRALAKRLAAVGSHLDQIEGVLLTHLDTDHFKPTLIKTLLEREIPVACHQRHEARIYRSAQRVQGTDARLLRKAGLLHLFDDGLTEAPMRDGAPVRVRPVPLAHDRSGTYGFVVHNRTKRLGYATDLGRVPGALVEAFVDVDVLAIESNYDPEMQARSDRPWFLKNRITSGNGHLSNGETLAAVRTIVARSARPPAHVVLLHLSRQCNCPDLVRSLYAADPLLGSRLCVSSQTDPTPWLDAAECPGVPGEQMMMF